MDKRATGKSRLKGSCKPGLAAPQFRRCLIQTQSGKSLFEAGMGMEVSEFWRCLKPHDAERVGCHRLIDGIERAGCISRGVQCNSHAQGWRTRALNFAPLLDGSSRLLALTRPRECVCHP